MVRSTRSLVFVAVVASVSLALAQTDTANTSSRARMTDYFSDVPIGGHVVAVPTASQYPDASRLPTVSGQVLQAESKQVVAVPPGQLPTAMPDQSRRKPATFPQGLATEPPAAKPAPEIPVVKPPAGKAPAKQPKSKTEIPAELPKTKPDVPAPPLPTDPAYRAPAKKSEEPGPKESDLDEPGRIQPPTESDSGQVWVIDEGEVALEAPAYYGRRKTGWLGSSGLSARPLGIEMRGWLDHGVTFNTFSPRDRSNFPVTFNDRSNEYQMNQLYVLFERAVDTNADWMQVGGRVDLLYGTDHTYTTALGLETFGDGSPKWNSANGPVGTNYGLSMPQAYLEAFAPMGGGLSVKLGHFYTIMGYEAVAAPENFFYSHAYTMQYGEPFTHTGLLAEYRVGDRLKVQAGFTRGWDTWEDNNNDLGFLGGFTWRSPSERSSLAMSVHTGPESDEPPSRGNIRTACSVVFTHECTDRLTYVFQHDFGYEPRATIANRTGHWYGINQYLFYQINPKWAAGLRFEWFHDKNGFRLGTIDGGDYYELTAGLNWTPRERLTIRPEVRWDWAKTDINPFVDGTLDHQIMVALDMIVTF